MPRFVRIDASNSLEGLGAGVLSFLRGKTNDLIVSTHDLRTDTEKALNSLKESNFSETINATVTALNETVTETIQSAHSFANVLLYTFKHMETYAFALFLLAAMSWLGRAAYVSMNTRAQLRDHLKVI